MDKSQVLFIHRNSDHVTWWDRSHNKAVITADDLKTVTKAWNIVQVNRYNDYSGSGTKQQTHNHITATNKSVLDTCDPKAKPQATGEHCMFATTLRNKCRVCFILAETKWKKPIWIKNIQIIVTFSPLVDSPSLKPEWVNKKCRGIEK